MVKFCLFFLLLWALPANSESCISKTASTPHGGLEWTIVHSSGHVTLANRDLGFPPFHQNRGGYAPTLTNYEHRYPVFTCSGKDLYFFIFQMLINSGKNGEVGYETQTLLFKKGIWDDPSQSQKVEVSNAIDLTGLASQLDRVVLFGKFDLKDRLSYAVYDVSNVPVLFFESGPFDIAQSASFCVTENDLFFVNNIGSLYTAYQVGSNGYISPKLLNWAPVRVECRPDGATIITQTRRAKTIYDERERRIDVPSSLGRGR